MAARRLLLSLGVLALLAAPYFAFACSVCGCGDPLQSVGNTPPMPGGFRLAIQSEHLTATAASDENPAATESLTQKTLNGTVVYGPVQNLSLILLVPVVEKDWKLEGGGTAEAASPIGLGDANFGLRYFFFQRIDVEHLRTHSLALCAGTTAPTGRENGQVDGVRIDQHAQLGTGAWGPYAGLLYTLWNDRWNLAANASAVFHGTNEFDYRFGNALRWGVEGQLHLGTAWAVSLAGEGRYARRDVSEGEEQMNTGGTVLDVTPGVWWNPVGTLGLYARVQVPVMKDLYGEQTVGTTVQVGTQFAIE